MRSSRKWVVGVVFLIIGLVVDLVGGIFLTIYAVKSSKCTLTVDGIVVDFDIDSSDAMAPIFFYEVDGETYLEPYNVYTSHSNYKFGDVKELLVNPDKPTEFMVADSIWMQLTSGICLGVGTVFILLSVICFIRAKKLKRMEYNQYSKYYSAGPVQYKSTYRLNGEEHKIVETDQPGYYNLNGKVVRRDDADNML